MFCFLITQKQVTKETARLNIHFCCAKCGLVVEVQGRGRVCRSAAHTSPGDAPPFGQPFHHRAEIVKAGGGSSATGLSAYIARDARIDQNGERFNFSHRADELESTGLILPAGRTGMGGRHGACGARPSGRSRR